MNKKYYVYMITNKRNKVLYTGVTNNLKRRIYEHKEKLVNGFSKKYNLCKLVYYEVTENIDSAIMREKKIKGGSRKDKIKLINGINPKWIDMYDEI